MSKLRVTPSRRKAARAAASVSGETIRVVAKRTGLGMDTLRAWERRYGFPKPERRPGSNRRIYSPAAVERLASLLVALRARQGRLFVLGVGGSAANASHAVNDFRKLAAIEAYAPTDNVAELTARVNDEGWDTVFAAWLRTSHLSARDGVLVLSVGGGDLERSVSANLVHALQHARSIGAPIGGIVGRDGGYTARVADACVVVPTVDRGLRTLFFCLIAIAGAMPSIRSTSGFSIRSRNWRAYADSDST